MPPKKDPSASGSRKDVPRDKADKSGSRGAKGGADKAVEVAIDEGVQAVWLLDDFDLPGLAPLTLDGPLGLLPVASVPAVEYGLDVLARHAAVREVVIFARRGVDALRSYLQASRWRAHLIGDAAATDAATPRIRVVTHSRARSAGDALRLIDESELVRSDVLLVLDGIVITDADFSDAIAAHEARVKAYPDCVVTVCVRSHAQGAASAAVPCPYLPLAEQTRLVVDPRDGRIATYDVLPAGSPAVLRPIPAVALKECPGAVPLPHLFDTRVYVCGRSLLVHFSDNYDYTCIREQYLHNEVLNVDLGFRYHVHEMRRGWAAPIADFATLKRVTASILLGHLPRYHPTRAWSAAAAEACSPVRCVAPGVFVSEAATVAASAVLRAPVFIGDGAVVGECAVLDDVVLGAGARIGARASVTRAILEDDATVADACTVTSTYLARSATVATDCSIGPNVVLGSGVVVNRSIASYHRLSCVAAAVQDDDSDDDAPSAATSASRAEDAGAALVGAGGRGRLWPASSELPPPDSDDEDEGDDAGQSIDTARMSVQRCLDELEVVRTCLSGAPVTLDADTHARHSKAVRQVLRLIRMVPISGSMSVTSLATAAQVAAAWHAAAQRLLAPASGAAAVTVPLVALAEERFRKVVRELLPAAPATCTEAEVRATTLEVKSFKYAENRSLHDVWSVCLPFLFDKLPRPSTSQGKLSVVAFTKSIRDLLERWTPLLSSAEDAFDDQVDAIRIVQRYCLDSANAADYRPIFGLVVQMLWELDLVSDITVSTWAEEAEEAEDAQVRELRASRWIQRLLEELDNQYEDEDEEEDDDGEDGDGDDEDDEDD